MVSFLQPVRWETVDAEEMLLRATPSLKGTALAKATILLLRMHNLVVNNELKACLRSVYYRAAFQSAKSNGKMEPFDDMTFYAISIAQKPSHSF